MNVSFLLDEADVPPDVRAVWAEAHALEQQASKTLILDAPQAVVLADEALALLRTLSKEAATDEHILLEAKVYFALGNAQERLSDYDGAFQSGEESLLRAKRVREEASHKKETLKIWADTACMDAYNILGNVCDRRGDYAAALRYRQADHDMAFSVGNVHQQAHTLLRLGGNYFRLGDYPTALNLLLQARSLFETLTDYAGLGSTWNNIGNVRYAENHYEAALEAYQTGLAQFQHTAEPYWQAGLLSNIAGGVSKTGQGGRGADVLGAKPPPS